MAVYCQWLVFQNDLIMTYLIITQSNVLSKHLPRLYSGNESTWQCRRHKETGAWSLGQKDPREEEMATHSSILAWKNPWIEKPRGPQSMGVTENWTQLSDWAHHSGCITRIRTWGVKSMWMELSWWSSARAQWWLSFISLSKSCHLGRRLLTIYEMDERSWKQLNRLRVFHGQ